VPRDGIVAIDGDCAGLYIAQQRAWVALELATGVRRLKGVADSGGADVLVSMVEGEVRISFADGRATASYHPSGSDPAFGDAVGVAVAVADASVAVDITSDPVTGGLAVEVGGRAALFAFAAPDLANAIVSDNLRIDSPADGDTPVCDYLQSRR
jgi:hypothetical protein